MATAQMMFTLAFIAGVAGTIPVLLYSTNRYEGFFDENTFFQTILVSLVMGLIGAFFYVTVSTYYLMRLANLSWALVIIFSAFFAMMDVSMKITVFNRPKYVDDQGLLFFGAAFGGGYATMIVLGFTYYGLWNFEYYQETFDLDSLGLFAGTVFLMFSMAFFHITQGTIIGGAVYRRDILSTAIRMVLLQVPLNMALLLWHVTRAWPFMLGCLIASGAVYLHYYEKTVMTTLPQKDVRKMRRDIRKRARDGQAKKVREKH